MKRHKILYALTISIFLITQEALSQDWHPPVELVNTGEDNEFPAIAVFDNKVHVAWMDYRNTTAFPEIYYKRSTDFGLTWEPGIKLSDMPSGSGPAYPKIAVRDNFLHIVWEEYNSINQVYYCKSTDDGASFTSPQTLTVPPMDISYPDIATFEDNVHIVFLDNSSLPLRSIYYIRSTDNGNTWTPGKLLTTDGQIAYKPKITASGQHIFVSWNEQTDNPSEIFFMRSLDNGNNWDAPVLLANTSIIQSQHDIMAPNDQDIHIVWEDRRDGTYDEIYYKRSNDAGDNWSTDKRLTFANLNSSNPSIAAVDDKISIAWDDMRDGSEQIYFKQSIDGGNEWGEDMRLSETTGLANYPSLSAFSDDIFLVWSQGTNYYLKDIYFRRSIDHSAVNEYGFAESEQPILYQNYPNPATHITSIKFYLPQGCQAWIDITDPEGKRIASFGRAIYPAGTNTVSLDASTLTTGTYLYQLHTSRDHKSGKAVTRKMAVH